MVGVGVREGLAWVWAKHHSLTVMHSFTLSHTQSHTHSHTHSHPTHCLTMAMRKGWESIRRAIII